MKRKVLVGALASSIAVGGTVGAATYSDSISKSSSQELDVNSDMESQTTLNPNKLIGVEELEDIVLNKVNGTIEEVELETKGEDKAYFEVEVKKDGKEYELVIDAYNGQILNVEKDDEDDDTKKQANNQTDHQKTVKAERNDDKEEVAQPESQSTSKEPIGKEKAIKLALEVASGKVFEVELEDDDGYSVYEVEVKGEKEADVKIDAFTGAILEIDLDD